MKTKNHPSDVLVHWSDEKTDAELVAIRAAWDLLYYDPRIAAAHTLILQQSKYYDDLERREESRGEAVFNDL